MSARPARARRRHRDAARTAAFRVLRAVTADGAYANLELGRRRAGLNPTDAAFVTELVSGTCRAMGTYDQVIERAAGRTVRSLQPAVLDVLRLGTHQLLAMRVPTHAALDGAQVGIDETWDVGGFPADHPLDPKLPAGEIVNCHCWMSPVVNDDFQIDPSRIWEGE